MQCIHWIRQHVSGNSKSQVSGQDDKEWEESVPRDKPKYRRLRTFFCLDSKTSGLEIKNARRYLIRAIYAHQRSASKLKSKLSRLRKTMTKELNALSRWACESIDTVATTYFETAILHLESRIELEIITFNYLRAQLGKLQSGELHSINDLSMQCPEGVVLRRSCIHMEKLLPDLLKQFIDAKQASENCPTPEQRKENLRHLLSEALSLSDKQLGESSALYFHPSDALAEASFRFLILDQRSSQGKLFHDWLQLLCIHSSVPVDAVMVFLDHFPKFILKEHGLVDSTELLPPLHLNLERLIFPRISHLLEQWTTAEEREKDAIFRMNVQLLRKLRGGGLVPESLLPLELPESLQRYHNESRCRYSSWSKWSVLYERSVPSAFPYSAACAALSRLEDECTPADIMLCALECVSSITTQHSDSLMLADKLFPLVVCVVINADIQHINARLGHLERWLDNKRFFGTSGYALSLIEAAVQHIVQWNVQADTQKDELLVPFDIEQADDYSTKR